MAKFKIGDRVKYISGRHGSSVTNPLIGTEFECAGTLDAAPCGVLWDNGEHNSYSPGDLIHIQMIDGKPNPNMAFLRKKQEEARRRPYSYKIANL